MIIQNMHVKYFLIEKKYTIAGIRHGFSGGGGGGGWGGAPLQKYFAPPPPPQRHLAPPQKSFCTPSNYTYFDLIFSYLVILITKFVKLLILWSQIPPCRPRKQVLLNIFLDLSGRCHQAPVKASSSTPRYLSTPPPRTKI